MSKAGLAKISKSNLLEFDSIQVVLHDSLHDCLSKGSTICRSGNSRGKVYCTSPTSNGQYRMDALPFFKLTGKQKGKGLTFCLAVCTNWGIRPMSDSPRPRVLTSGVVVLSRQARIKFPTNGRIRDLREGIDCPSVLGPADIRQREITAMPSSIPR